MSNFISAFLSYLKKPWKGDFFHGIQSFWCKKHLAEGLGIAAVGQKTCRSLEGNGSEFLFCVHHVGPSLNLQGSIPWGPGGVQVAKTPIGPTKYSLVHVSMVRKSFIIFKIHFGRKKKNSYFPLYWLVNKGILIMVSCNPYIIG